jgi:AraC family transcriptional regulator
LHILDKVRRNLPPLPPGVDCPFAVGQRVLSVHATYIFPTVGVFPHCYELVIIHTGFPTMSIDGKDYSPWLHSAVMVNPGQPHLAKTSGPASLYNPFFIDSELIETVAREMGGKGKVRFENRVCETPPELLTIVQLFFQETAKAMPGNVLSISSLETMLAVTLLRHLPNNQELKLGRAEGMDRHSVERVKEFIHQHFQENLKLEELARVANYSSYHFIRFFKQATGKTPYEYLMDVKIEKAAQMLQNKELSITEVCYSCGFVNPSHFSTVFKRKKGVSPSRYQKYI